MPVGPKGSLSVLSMLSLIFALSAVNLGQSQVAKVSQNSTLGGNLCQPNVKKIQRMFFKGSELYFLTVTFMLIIFWAKSGKVFDKVLSHENLKVSNCLLFFSSLSAFLNPKSLIG